MSNPNRPQDPYTAGVPGFHPQTGATQPTPEVPPVPSDWKELIETQTEDKFIESVKKQSSMVDKMKAAGPQAMMMGMFMDMLKPFMMLFIPFKPIIAEVTKILTIMLLPIVKALIPPFQLLAEWLAEAEPYAVAFGEAIGGIITWLTTGETIGDAWEALWESDPMWNAIENAWEAFWAADVVWEGLRDAWNSFVSDLTLGILQPTGGGGGGGGGGGPCAGLIGLPWIACMAEQLVSPRAMGGVTTGPTLSLLGDNPSGIEMIVPLEKAGEMGFGGGGNGMLEVKMEENTRWLKKMYYQQLRSNRGLRRNG